MGPHGAAGIVRGGGSCVYRCSRRKPVGVQQPAPAGTQISGDAGSTSYLTHVTTDKPIYRGGEKLYVRGVVLSADGHTPMLSLTRRASYEIRGPKGDIVTSGVSAVVDSVVGFSWDIPPSQAGGEYLVRISHPSGRSPER